MVSNATEQVAQDLNRKRLGIVFERGFTTQDEPWSRTCGTAFRGSVPCIVTPIDARAREALHARKGY
jgi:hypothetical protein